METPSRHSFNLDGSTRIFPVPSPIKGDNYCRIEVNGAILNDRSKYDIVNNSVVFVSATDVPAGGQLDILVVQSEEAIGQLAITTNIDIVATGISTINTVGASIASINAVAAAIDDVLTAETSATTATAQAALAVSAASTATTQAGLATTASTAAVGAQAAVAANALAATNAAQSATTSAATATTRAGEAVVSADAAAQSAIEAANSAGGGIVAISNQDQNVDYLETKFVAGTDIEITKINPGGVEQLKLSSPYSIAYAIALGG
jgi:hypothetical protein